MSAPEPRYRLVPYVSPLGKMPVQDFLDALEEDDPDAAAAFYDLIAPLVEEHGAALGMPHFKQLPPTDFSEIRWDGKDRGHHRIYCTLEKNGRILLLHGVTKRWPKFEFADKKICAQRYRDYCSTDYDPQQRKRPNRA